jgi:hypothetical protein
MIINSDDLDETSAYKLLIGSIIPRPIAWVSTLSTAGVGNIAPISFFTCVGRKPPRYPSRFSLERTASPSRTPWSTSGTPASS